MFVFKIVALVYIMVAGQTVGNEPVRIKHSMAFPTVEACQAFMTSEVFQMQRAALASSIMASLARARAANPTPEDVAEPGIAITASCEEDDSI